MAEIYVTSTADSGAGSLRQAISSASDGDVILFDSDVFPVGQITSILLSSYITINKSVSIYGGVADGQGGYTSGATKKYYVYREVEGVKTKTYIDDENPAQDGETVLFENVCRVALDGQRTQAPDAEGLLDGWSGTRIVNIVSSTVLSIVLSGIVFQNAVSNQTQVGSCVHSTSSSNQVASDILLEDCSFKRAVNTVGTGGAMTCVSNALLKLVSCSFNEIMSATAGAFFSGRTSATIEDCVFDSCVSENAAGALYISSSTPYVINNCRFTNCRANTAGAITLYTNANGVFRDCTFDANQATASGATVFNQGVRSDFYNCVFKDNVANNGAGIYFAVASINTLTNCVFDGCIATSNGGGVYSHNDSQNTLNDCSITNCSAINGGAVYSTNTSQTTLNGCSFTNCDAVNGGGVYNTSSGLFSTTGCCFNDCSASSNGGGVYIYGTTHATLNNCIFTNCSSPSGGGLQFGGAAPKTTLNACILDATSTVVMPNGDYLTISGGITTIAAATLNAATITIADGAALTITSSATIGAATFTSAGRGYLAVAAGIDTSAATLTNVVLCAYGADVSSFTEVYGVLEWDADDPSVSVLLEREDNDAWTTLAQTTGESLDYYLPPKVNLRLFDGERFLTTATPDSRTYFFIGGAEGSFDDAEDWSLTKNGTAIPQSPTITDCAFVIQGAEGDVAISKGSANVTNATIIPAGTNDIAVVVDEATVLAGTERFTGTLTTTGDVTIDGDASKLAIVVDGTLEVAGSLKLATLTLTSGSSVVFASADDVLVVSGSATVNDATFSCEEPTAYFTAPVGTDLTQATFTNVYVATKGAEVVSVTGSRFGKNYSINIVSEDNTLPVTVEYRLEGTNEWIVADPAFVGTTFQIRLDDEATFRVYNGETFTEATMKVYGLYNEMAAIVEIGYLI